MYYFHLKLLTANDNNCSTGVTGLLGSGIATKVLEAGYKVVAVVRNQEKADIVRAAYEKRFGSGSFETVLVDDISAPGALNDALQGKFEFPG